MILKLKKGDSWIVFDGFDRIQYRDIQQGEGVAVRFDVYDYTKEDTNKPLNEGSVSAEIWLYWGTEAKAQILADRPIYLLGNDGKTIERI